MKICEEASGKTHGIFFSQAGRRPELLCIYIYIYIKLSCGRCRSILSYIWFRVIPVEFLKLNKLLQTCYDHFDDTNQYKSVPREKFQAERKRLSHCSCGLEQQPCVYFNSYGPNTWVNPIVPIPVKIRVYIHYYMYDFYPDLQFTVHFGTPPLHRCNFHSRLITLNEAIGVAI